MESMKVILFFLSLSIALKSQKLDMSTQLLEQTSTEVTFVTMFQVHSFKITTTNTL